MQVLASIRHVCHVWLPNSQFSREISSPTVCFVAQLFGLALTQVCTSRLITQPDHQWAHPGIVSLGRSDGVALHVPSDILALLT